MRRIRTLAILASLAIAVGGAGLAKAATSSLASSSQKAATSRPATASHPDAKSAPTVTCTEDNENKNGCPDEDCSVSDGDEASSGCPSKPPVVCNEANENKNDCPDEDCSVKDGDENQAPCTNEKCTEANESSDQCEPDHTKVKCANDGDKDADDASPPCPKPPVVCPDNEKSNLSSAGPCEFDGATFYAAETDPMKVSVDASAVNAKSTSKSGNDPIAGEKVTTTDCNAPQNACDSVVSRDETPTDITDYSWVFVAWRAHPTTENPPDIVQQLTVDSGTSPQASAQFTKTQGDDVVQTILTITEKGEGKTVIKTPMPSFPIFSGALNPADAPPTPTTLGNVILEPCDHGGLITAPETIGDTLGDNGAPLFAQPDVQGPISSAIESNLITTPLASIGNEVACLVSALPGGAL